MRLTSSTSTTRKTKGLFHRGAKYAVVGMLGWLAVGIVFSGYTVFLMQRNGPSKYQISESLALAVHLSAGFLLIRGEEEEITLAFEERDQHVICDGVIQKKSVCLLLPLNEQYDSDCGMFSKKNWPDDCIHLPASDIYLTDPVARGKIWEALLRPCAVLANAEASDAASRDYIARHMRQLACEDKKLKHPLYGLVTFGGTNKASPHNIHYFFETQ